VAEPPAPAPVPEREAAARLRHELRTPLNQIIGYSEMLAEEAAEQGQASLVDDLGKIGAAARRLLEAIERHFGARDRPAAPAEAPPDPAPSETAALLQSVEKAWAETPTDELRSGRGIILVVDDDPLNRDMLARRLESRGYEVVAAEGGRQALAQAAARPFDLVLLDVMMPEVSGLDVLRELRSRHSVAELPVIMATARDRSEDTVLALKLGANDYVTKPLDFPVVLARAETQLALKRAVEEVSRLAGELEIRNRFIKQTFGRYLSDEIVDSLLATPEGLKLGGERRTVTVLMSDLRGFTALTEHLPPEQVVRLLNNYLGTMTEIIFDHQGTIDEFLGDAILALFGAPIRRADDARRALACATAMQRAIALVNERNRRDGLPDVQMGIAVHSGDVVVGNVGSERRTKYGVVGSPVNLTARIESFTVGGQILVSEQALAAAGSDVRVGRRFSLEVKGFPDPVAVRELLGVGASESTADEGRPAAALEELAEGIPVHCAVLEGKRVGAATFTGRITRVSADGAEVQPMREVRPLTSLRLRLLDEGGGELAGDLYGKVIETWREGFLLRFTSVVPEAAARLRAARRAGS
jgi:class 3 adenylate cyclase